MNRIKDDSAQSLATRSLACKEQLKKLSSFSHHDQHLDAWARDQAAQFNMWAANAGVFAEPHRSLDFLLEGIPETRDLIALLLDTLKKDIIQSQTPLNAVYQNYNPLKSKIDNSGEINDDSSISDYEFLSSSDEIEVATPNEPLSKSQVAIQETIDRLHRLATIIRRSGKKHRQLRIERYLDKEKNREVYDRIKMLVFEKVDFSFPKASLALKERMAESVAKRRSRFSYIEKHQQKIAAPNHPLLAPQPPVVYKEASTLPQFVDQGIKQPPGGASTILSATEDTKLDQKQLRAVKEDHPESVASAYISQSGFPDPPKLRSIDTTFHCPYCCLECPIKEAHGEFWKQHVISDFEPFFCVFDDCKHPYESSDSFSAWIAHIQEEHMPLRWHCTAPIHEPMVFSEKERFEEHIQTHYENLTGTLLSTLTKHSIRHETRIFQSCPFCGGLPEELEEKFPNQQDMNAQQALQRHVGDHLIAVALILPPIRVDKLEEEVRSIGSSAQGQGDHDFDPDQEAIIPFTHCERGDQEKPCDCRDGTRDSTAEWHTMSGIVLSIWGESKSIQALKHFDDPGWPPDPRFSPLDFNETWKLSLDYQQHRSVIKGGWEPCKYISLPPDQADISLSYEGHLKDDKLVLFVQRYDGIAGFLAAIKQLISITSKIVSYFNEVENAPKERAKLSRELAGLLALLTDLKHRVEETTLTDTWRTSLLSLSAERGPLLEFQKALYNIADKMTSGVNSRIVLTWKSDKKEVDATLSKIERLKSLVGLALQKDNFKLSLAMKEETTVGFQEVKVNGDVEKISRWLDAPLPSTNHNTAIKIRQPSTGEWFMQSREFGEWKTGANSFIWLHGIPGCGKTILCSTIIQDVISNYQSEPTTVVAYFYFDFRDQDKKRTEMLIRSLIVQFAAQSPRLPEILQSAHSRLQSKQKKLTIAEMTTILRQILMSFNTTYILLDAIDECTDREDLLEFIKALMGWNISNLHLLITSRKEMDLAISLEPLVTRQVCIQSALVDDDIRVHVLERLSNDPKLRKWSVDVQREIADTLMREPGGMFRWVVCQLDSLRKCLKIDVLRKVLKTLPKTLDETYERILSNLDEEYGEDALKVFQWLCFSARPIRLDEMVDVLAIDNSCFRPEQRLPDPLDILTICSTLVSVTTKNDKSAQNTESQELRLAHFSVEEFLTSERLKKASIHRYHITPLSAHVSMAKTCLTYLLYFESPTILTVKFDHEFPLIKYAAQFWPWHYSYITSDSDREAIDFLACTLVESKPSCFTNWLKVFNPDDPLSESNIDLESNDISSPLYYMSCLGVSGAVQLILKKDTEVNAEGGFHGYALAAASYNGHEKTVRLLLENGADVNAEGGAYGNALSAASFHGHEKVSRLLLEHGADVNAQSGRALQEASKNGQETIVRLLLECGADVDAQSGRALLEASKNGQETVMRQLLKFNADVNLVFDDNGKTLQGISADDHEAVMLLLLKELRVSREREEEERNT